MQVAHHADNAHGLELSALSTLESATVFHARHLVSLMARAELMIYDLNHQESTLLDIHLMRIRTIASEAGIPAIHDAVDQLIAQLPYGCPHETQRWVSKLHHTILDTYLASQHRLRSLNYH
ncbi:hypothetical protein [Halomonas alkaliantarctica]|uniref:hypothetical protein n=1 Tax=Halomonas alkaliantarctica TaxID=232346 RepID=UPI0004AAA38E|nr:hypothetical protein [Halomonas alkaliantarctica]